MNIKELENALAFFKEELVDFVICLSHDSKSKQDDDGCYLNKLIKYHKVAIKLLESAIDTEKEKKQ